MTSCFIFRKIILQWPNWTHPILCSTMEHGRNQQYKSSRPSDWNCIWKKNNESNSHNFYPNHFDMHSVFQHKLLQTAILWSSGHREPDISTCFNDSIHICLRTLTHDKLCQNDWQLADLCIDDAICWSYFTHHHKGTSIGRRNRTWYSTETFHR